MRGGEGGGEHEVNEGSHFRAGMGRGDNVMNLLTRPRLGRAHLRYVTYFFNFFFWWWWWWIRWS